MLKPRTLVLILLLLVSFTWLSSSGLLERINAGDATTKPNNHNQAGPVIKKLQLKAADAKLFVQENRYNDVICFLIDMSLPSGQNRFFIYDLKKDTLKNSGLVTHGRCNENWGRKKIWQHGRLRLHIPWKIQDRSVLQWPVRPCL